MRSFSWEYFTLTGDVDAYLLYRDMDQLHEHQANEDVLLDEEDIQAGQTGYL